MSKFRIILIALVSWLFVFFNIERIHEPFNIASFVYVLSALGIVALMCTPQTSWPKTLSLFGVCFVLLLVLKWQWHYPIVGEALPITITETVALFASFAMAHYLSIHLFRFETGSRDLSLTKAWESTGFDTLQPQMYREVNRARHFERPMSLAFLKANGDSLETAVHAMIQESQRITAQRMARAKVAETIGESLRDCDIVARYRDGFVILLPETDDHEAEAVTASIQQQLQDKMNVDLDIGIASFPHEEVTLTGLLSRAVENIEASKDIAPQPAQPSSQSVVFDQIPS